MLLRDPTMPLTCQTRHCRHGSIITGAITGWANSRLVNGLMDKAFPITNCAGESLNSPAAITMGTFYVGCNDLYKTFSSANNA